jgi:hypothetical protein
VNAPFGSGGDTIGVSVVTSGELTVPAGAVLVTMDPPTGHEHDGAECLVCNTRNNVRVRLFELLEQARTCDVPSFDTVIVDARQVVDPQAIVDALVPGRLPAFGLRDHAVARRFRLTPALASTP